MRDGAAADGVDVAADDGSWIGLGEMRERECWGRDEGGVFWTQMLFNG